MYHCTGVSLDPLLLCWYVIRLRRRDYFQLSAAFDPMLITLSLSLPLSLIISFTLPLSTSSKDELRKGLCFNTVRSLLLTCQSACLCVISVKAFRVIVTQLSIEEQHLKVHTNHRMSEQEKIRGRIKSRQIEAKWKGEKKKAGKKKTDCSLLWAEKHFCGHSIW